MKTLVFFNNKGGVGKTTLAYHLAWKLADLGLSVVAADLDPQANLTAMFLEEDRLAELWPEAGERRSIYGAVAPILRGLGDVRPPHLEEIADTLALLPGDLSLSLFEDKLALDWPRCGDGHEDAFRVITAFHRILEDAGGRRDADVVVLDVGPNLGAINRAALLAADHVVFPLAPDLFSLQGLRNLGPALRTWRQEWTTRRPRAPEGLSLPAGSMTPTGYVLLQHAIRLDRPVRAYAAWMARIPGAYRRHVLEAPEDATVTPETDPHCLAELRHYRSLVPLAMAARKPIFHLRAADGALGAHAVAAQRCGEDFTRLARGIADKAGLAIP